MFLQQNGKFILLNGKKISEHLNHISSITWLASKPKIWVYVISLAWQNIEQLNFVVPLFLQMGW